MADSLEKIYVVKNCAPWIMDELLVFSLHTKFKVIFIREPSDFYTSNIIELEKRGIEITKRPMNNNINHKKLGFCLTFLTNYLLNFTSTYSLVVGVKSLWWFLHLDEKLFPDGCSIHAQFATQASLISLLQCKYQEYKKSGSPINYFFTFHAYDIYFKNKWFKVLVKNCDRCFSISNYNLLYVRKKYKGVQQNKLHLCRLGAFKQSDLPPKVHSKQGLHIGLISWFVEKKGIRYLLEAQNFFSKNKIPVRLSLAGDGPKKEWIQEYINQHKLSYSVTLLGKINGQTKADFFSSIHALVLPAITIKDNMDGIPVVLMEAIANGLPIISTNVSGIPEICIDHYNGLLIPERNVNALINAIHFLAKDKAAYETFSKNSLELANQYDIEQNCLDKLRMMRWV